MNAALRKRSNEVDVGNVEATDAKMDALRSSLDEVTEDAGELRADIKSVHSEMHAGFAALRESIVGMQASVAALRGTMKTMFWSVGAVGMLVTIFFAAGKALHWFVNQ